MHYYDYILKASTKSTGFESLQINFSLSRRSMGAFAFEIIIWLFSTFVGPNISQHFLHGPTYKLVELNMQLAEKVECHSVVSYTEISFRSITALRHPIVFFPSNRLFIGFPHVLQDGRQIFIEPILKRLRRYLGDWTSLWGFQNRVFSLRGSLT